MNTRIERDTFGPIGPWLVTPDEIPDPQNLSMWLEVDGHRYQNGSTRTMIFNVVQIVSYVSQFMSLQPGDVPESSQSFSVRQESNTEKGK